MPQDTTRLSLRDIFHMLDNKHLVFVMISDVLIEKFEMCLSRQDLPLELKEVVSDYIESLRILKNTGNEADVLLNETKPIIYAKLDANEGYFDKTLIQQKLKEPGPHSKKQDQKN